MPCTVGNNCESPNMGGSKNGTETGIEATRENQTIFPEETEKNKRNIKTKINLNIIPLIALV